MNWKASFFGTKANIPSGVTVTVDGLSATLLMASIFYLFCVFVIRRKLKQLYSENPEFGTKKMLVISLGLVCIIRLMSFIGVAALDGANVRAHYAFHPHEPDRTQSSPLTSSTASSNFERLSSHQGRNQYFYDKAMIVLFDLPNCIVVSTYVLLTLVWAECLLLSRFHTEDTIKWRSRWLSVYMLFNTALYSTQIILYFLVLLPKTSNVATPMLYAVMTGINFAAVFLVFVLYIFLGVKFSGYPFRSTHSKKAMRKVSVTIASWSVTRIIWGVAMLTVYIDDLDLLENDSNAPSYLYLFLLFFICEILPISLMLDFSYDAIFEFESRANKEMRMLASGERVVTFLQEEKATMGNISAGTEMHCVEIEKDDQSESFDVSISSLSKFNWEDNQRSLYGEEGMMMSRPLLERKIEYNK